MNETITRITKADSVGVILGGINRLSKQIIDDKGNTQGNAREIRRLCKILRDRCQRRAKTPALSKLPEALRRLYAFKQAGAGSLYDILEGQDCKAICVMDLVGLLESLQSFEEPGFAASEGIPNGQ